MNQTICIVSADFYQDIAAMLLMGATQALEEMGYGVDVIHVPGALEIPPAIAFAAIGERYAGFVALGCVIRGETTHYDTVCNESARGLMQLGIDHYLPIGNGILTVESHAQAVVRADVTQKNKGRDAAIACVRLIEIAQHYAGFIDEAA